MIECVFFLSYYSGEKYVTCLQTVKCVYSSIDLNQSNRFEEIIIKGKLVLTTFKLQFIPHAYDTQNYFKCFYNSKQYFKYWSENDIPLTFIYGIYTCILT